MESVPEPPHDHDHLGSALWDGGRRVSRANPLPPRNTEDVLAARGRRQWFPGSDSSYHRWDIAGGRMLHFEDTGETYARISSPSGTPAGSDRASCTFCERRVEVVQARVKENGGRLPTSWDDVLPHPLLDHTPGHDRRLRAQHTAMSGHKIPTVHQILVQLGLT
jgi:hypothetical protein